jgi:hypothetical protein
MQSQLKPTQDIKIVAKKKKTNEKNLFNPPENTLMREWKPYDDVGISTHVKI